MNYLQIFMRIARVETDRESHPNFMDKGLRDFELELRGIALSAQDVARQALIYFCLEEGRFNGFMPGIRAVWKFLKQCGISPANPVQAFQDLNDIMEDCSEEMIQKWLDSL